MPTNAKAAYLDTSAFLKLVFDEPESAALSRYLVAWPRRRSASLLRTEALRAVRRGGGGAGVREVRRLLNGIGMVGLDDRILDAAGELQPPALRSLDAIHLAAALSISSDLGVFVTYDERLGEAAAEVGISVSAPR